MSWEKNKNFTDYIEINPHVGLEKGKEYPFVDMANLSTNGRTPLKIEKKCFFSGVKFQKGDTVIAGIEPCFQNGKKFFCKNIDLGFGSTEYLVFRPKENMDACFLYYFMQKQFIRQSMINSMSGATGRQRVNKNIFSSIKIDVPTLEEQRIIGNIISSYDDLIEIKQKQIKLLEEAAQRLYMEWFVDLRFPGYEGTEIVDGLPEGWASCTLDDVIDFNPKVVFSKGKLKQSVPMSALSTSSMVIKSSEITLTTSTSGSKFQNGDTLLARITPCLENGKIGFVSNIESFEGAIGSTEFIVMRSKKLNPYMVYLLSRTNGFRKAAINSMTGSDGRQRVQVDKIKDFQYKLPSEKILQGFSEIAKPIFNAVSVYCKECEKLAEARDRLILKLMSGEIELGK